MVNDRTELAATTDESFHSFYGDRFAPLSRLAFLLTGSSEAADEIAQEACEQVLRRWDDIDFPRAYARRAVISGARSWGRRRTVRESTASERERFAELDGDAIAVRIALADLPPRQREVLVLRYYADLKVDDIAAEVGARPGTVKSLIHRGLARLEEELT
jgi:RNA polymerase sigma factor (sigma-70 family)